MSDDEPRDPFLAESGGPWHHSLRKGEMLFLGLAEQDNIFGAIGALHALSEADLKCIVLERLYVWHATQVGVVLGVEDWLKPSSRD